MFRFNDLKRKKTGIHVTGGIQKDLISYLKYEYERPIYSAGKYKVGTIKRGNDGILWTNRQKNGYRKWDSEILLCRKSWALGTTPTR